MFPRLFQIGSYSQATYGVLVAVAFLVALSVISASRGAPASIATL